MYAVNLNYYNGVKEWEEQTNLQKIPLCKNLMLRRLRSSLYRINKIGLLTLQLLLLTIRSRNRFVGNHRKIRSIQLLNFLQRSSSNTANLAFLIYYSLPHRAVIASLSLENIPNQADLYSLMIHILKM